MKNKYPLLILLTFIALYFMWPEPETAKENTQSYNEPEVLESVADEPSKPSPKSRLKKKKLAITQKPKTPFKMRTVNGPSIEGFRSKKPPKYLSFKRIKGNFAVTYGDVLIGKVEPKLQTGFAEIKPTNSWFSIDIPYSINPEYKNPDLVHQVMNEINNSTNLNFYPFEGEEEDSIVFMPADEHCYSFLGRMGGHQPIMLSPKCGKQQIMHEVMHALGFVHEQSRTDRDKYVDVLWDNIDPQYEMQFALVPEQLMETLQGSTFNPNSIMMYQDNFFAREPGLKTLSLKSGQKIIPHQNGLSDEDIRRINYIYY